MKTIRAVINNCAMVLAFKWILQEKKYSVYVCVLKELLLVSETTESGNCKRKQNVTTITKF